MKSQNSYTSHDQNWQCPEKTWFRERLNALKARESEQRRRPLIASERSDQMADPAPANKADLKVD
jgi:hypothetical protein